MRCQPPDTHPVYIWLKSTQSCQLCSLPSDTSFALCSACELDLPWQGLRCECCALPLPMAGQRCADCLKRAPAFTRVEAPWRYEFPVDTLITRFKHQANWPLGRLLGELLIRDLHQRFEHGLQRPDLLLPVPMARRRFAQRGFNQAGMLARWLSQGLQLPWADRTLLRTRDTTAQQGLDAAERLRNLRHAFTLANGAVVAGKHLALVDDVVTTGATANQLAKLLLKAGARRVDVYCLARTPKPGS